MRSSKVIRACVACVALTTALAASTSSAQADTSWFSNGGLAGVTASAGTTTLTFNSVGITCNTPTISGGTLQGWLGPLSGNWDVLTGFTLGFAGCTAAGLPTNATCAGTPSTYTATNYNFVTDVVIGFVKNLNCTFRPTSFPSCTMTVVNSGTGGKAFEATYANGPTTLAIRAPGQAMTAVWVNCPFISPATGSAAATINTATYTMTAPVKPCVRYGSYPNPSPPCP